MPYSLSSEDALDKVLLAGVHETEKVVRRLGSSALFVMAKHFRAQRPLIYWLDSFPKNNRGLVREALRHLFYRNGVQSYFLATPGELIDESSVNSVNGRRDVLFLVASDTLHARNAYCEILRRPDGSVRGLSPASVIADPRPGPFHGLLNPSGVLNIAPAVEVVAEELEIGRLLLDSDAARAK